MPPCHPLRAEHANQNRGADWDERAVLSPLRSEGSYLRRAGWRTGKGGVVSAELVQDVLNLALANGLAEDFEDSANRALPLLVAEGNDAGDASHELARWKSLRPPIVFQAGPDRLWQLRGEVVGFPWVDARAKVEERCTHHALRDGFVEAAELGYARDECRCIHCDPPAKCRASLGSGLRGSPPRSIQIDGGERTPGPKPLADRVDVSDRCRRVEFPDSLDRLSKREVDGWPDVRGDAARASARHLP